MMILKLRQTDSLINKEWVVVVQKTCLILGNMKSLKHLMHTIPLLLMNICYPIFSNLLLLERLREDLKIFPTLD